VSQAILQGRKQEAGSISRVAAPKLEGRVLAAVRAALVDEPGDDRSIHARVEQVTIGRAGLHIRLNDHSSADRTTSEEASKQMICVSWTPTLTRRRREIIQGDSDRRTDIRPMRIEAQRAFVATYRKARSWLDRLVADPNISVATLAASERRTERSIRQTLSLAFIDPSLAEAAMDGRLPRGFGITRLMDLPRDWSDQWPALGLARS
jgi:hypothetical protein